MAGNWKADFVKMGRGPRARGEERTEGKGVKMIEMRYVYVPNPQMNVTTMDHKSILLTKIIIEI